MFEYIDRQFEKTMVLAPGWAFDWRIFEPVELDCNYLLFKSTDPDEFAEGLAEEMDRRAIGKVSIFGWSQGGFAGFEFTKAHPGKVEHLILSGMRIRYEQKGLELIKRFLKRSSRAYLSQFYKQCFEPAPAGCYERFHKTLEKEYFSKFGEDELIDSLDWLGKGQIDLSQLGGDFDITVIHGENDQIADVKQAGIIAAQNSRARLIVLADTGHVTFLGRDLGSVIYGH